MGLEPGNFTGSNYRKLRNYSSWSNCTFIFIELWMRNNKLPMDIL